MTEREAIVPGDSSSNQKNVEKKNIGVLEVKFEKDSKLLIGKTDEASVSQNNSIDLKIDVKTVVNETNGNTQKNLCLQGPVNQSCINDLVQIESEANSNKNKEDKLKEKDICASASKILNENEIDLHPILNRSDNETDCKAQDRLSNQSDVEADVIEHLDSSLLYQNPTFAEICSFFNTFTHLLGLKPMSIAKLDKLFCTLINGDADPELIDLHVTLMRKIYMKSARSDKWEKSLQKFSAICPGLDNESRQLQRHHYVDLSTDAKLSLLKALCDSQFECNVKFKENISNTFRNCELRIAPFGRDKCGLLYYLQIDCDLDLRIYTEEPEDEAGTSWSLRARNETELIDLIEMLKCPDFGNKNTTDHPDDDVEEMDEEQLLDSPKSIGKKISLSDSTTVNTSDLNDKTTIDIPIEKRFKLDDEQRKKIVLQTKFDVLLDRYRKIELLNKRKVEREKRRKENSTPAVVIALDNDIVSSNDNLSSIKENDHKDEKNVADKNDSTSDNVIGDALMAAELDAEDRRRILPRRNARNAAMSNLKLFTSSPRLSSACDSSDSAVVFKHKLAFVSTAGSNSDENSDEEISDGVDDEEDENENSSDDDFLLDSDERPTLRKVGKPPTKRKLVKQKGSQKKPARGNKRRSHASRIAAIQRASLAAAAASRKKLSAFAIDDSSDEEEAEPIKEGSVKSKKRATELTLCQHCKSPSRPDLLLLCDNCDDAWHTFCLHPQLWYVPDGDWFCPPCEHNFLINRLTYVLLMLCDEKRKQDQQKKKEAAADRLKREMDYIGISLNNIIPSENKKDDGQYHDSLSSEESEDSGNGQYLQRKSKKRAMKMVTSRSRLERKAMVQFGPIITVAEGRSRRAMKKVDYNFRSYEEQLQEAMYSIDPDAVLNENEQSVSGTDHAKDMKNNTLDANDQQKKIVDKSDDEEEPCVTARDRDAPARPPKERIRNVKAAGKKNKRLTDLDADDVTDSDTDEWHESSADNFEEDPEPSEDEYLPSERRSRIRGIWARHKSDDEFINDDSDPDYIDKGRGRKLSGFKTKARKEIKSKNKRNNETSTSDEDNGIQPSASDSEASKSSRNENKLKNKLVSSSDDEGACLPRRMTEAGRPLRKAAAKVGARLIDQVDDDEEEEISENDEDIEMTQHETKDLENKADGPVNDDSSLTKIRSSDQSTNDSKTKLSVLSSNDKPTLQIDDTDEFKPDEMDEVEADEEEEEAEVELENEAVDDDEDLEDESSIESSSKSAADDDDLSQNNSEDEEINNKFQSPFKQVKRKLPPPRKNLKRKKKATNRSKKVGRGRDKKLLTNEKKSSPALPKKTTTKCEIPINEPKSITMSFDDSKTNKSVVNSVQQELNELPATSSNADSNTIQKQHKLLSSNPKKVEIPLTTNLLDSSKVQRTEIQPPLLENSNVEKSHKDIPIKSTNVQNFENTTNVQTSSVELNIKSKLEAFVKEKSQSKIEKALTTPISYPNQSKTISTTTNLSTLNIPLASSKMSTTIFQPVNPQQLSQYFLRPSNSTPPPPPAQQKSVVSTSSKHVSATLATVSNTQPSTMSPAAHIVLQQRPMQPFNSTCFAPFPNSTSPNVSVPQVAIMPTNLPPPITGGLPPGCLPQFIRQPPATYFMQQGAPPQIIYQTLQPYGNALPPHAFPGHPLQPPQLNSNQTGIIDQESLSHALAGAMNPEDL